MYFVYSIQSTVRQNQYYIGLTADLERRLEEHNSGKAIHTNKFKPWNLVACFGFPQKEEAEKFERYLKTGSGRTFCKRHL